ncbi:MAG: carboxypeptidase-like regulatory domain-containing protein [Candidatus Bathyarchaeia archaeon]
MSKRIIAAFMVALFVLGAALSAAPSWAHTTLGMQTDGSDPNGMYRIHDVDTNFGHVPGVTGYVFPGGGKDWYAGIIPPLGPEYPGYQSPWTNYPPNAPYMTWWQLRGTSYAPFGAILTSTEDTQNIGDLIFAINFTTEGIPVDFEPPWGTANYNYTKLTIYIPPEFVPVEVDWEAGATDNIISTIPGEDISVKRADVKDPFGPSWWVISIEGDIKFLEAHNYEEWYYVRVNSVAAPLIAGRYFFKMFLNDSYPRVLADPDHDGDIDKIITSTMPVENYPVLLVKGEIDPGIAFGTVRFGGYDADLYGQPIPLAGVVRFVGTAMDPYTGELTGRHVEARGYFNDTANGHYEVEGIAPGRYDVYASAAGYPEVKVAEGVEVLPGKSLHLDIYLNPGVIIHGKIYAKHNWGEAKWWDTPAWWWQWDKVLPVTVEIYDSNEWPEPFPGAVWGDVDGTVPDNWMVWERGAPTDLVWTDKGFQPSSTAHLKSFSPINLTDSPFTCYDWDEQTGLPNPVDVAFPWDDVYGTAVRHNGVGPAQDWWAGDDADEVSSFTFQFGEKDMANDVIYGAPTG